MRLFGGTVRVNDRIVEYPQILRWLPEGNTVLDIGCVSSRLPTQLTSVGYAVHGPETRAYPYSHRNFTFFRSDLFQWQAPRHYDLVCLVSVLEQLGLGGYGDFVTTGADFQVMARIREWLAPGGVLLMLVPHG
jgi:hypothetical protein